MIAEISWKLEGQNQQLGSRPSEGGHFWAKILRCTTAVENVLHGAFNWNRTLVQLKEALPN